MKYLRMLFDRFTLAIIAMVVLAALVPATGKAAPIVDRLTLFAIALLFFMHGAKLSRRALVEGLSHWKLHLLVFFCTFALFPLLGFALRPLLQPLTGKLLYQGLLFMCMLPATVQSSIAFTSIARGNISAAICSAAASSLVGIIITPLLVLWLMDAGSNGGVDASAVGDIVLQLFVPFALGQLARPWLGGWIARHAGLVRAVDQGSILMVVYSAFSASVVGGLWKVVPVSDLIALALACCLLLAIVLVVVWQLALRLGFNMEDRITILFAGSKKSMASGVPMAQVLFSGSIIGPMILPLMLFHQIQLMACAVLARRFAQRDGVSSAG
ncbi:MAG TPA: bile acid:sodium symporter family protein [Wenzhouxiangella sp.]|nr:bile acid:sodium symporter family protein [Wenzhouxiangella sp.]